LETVPQTFEKLNCLSWLNLADNRLTDISNVNWRSLSNSLSFLDISRNLLTKLPDSICDLSKLSDLSCSSNSIPSLPSNFGQNLSCLRYLDLSSNKKLEQLPKTISFCAVSLNYL